MPKTTRKTRNKRRGIKEQDDTESESGKLSETQEVVKRLSRTRLGKENAVKPNIPSNTKVKGPSDPYDADSEVESDVNSQADTKDDSKATCLSPMAVDQPFNEIPISSVPRALRHNPSRLLNHEQSTPSTTTPGQSDDSFFGFDKALNTPLPFSPVPMRPMPSPSNSEASSVFSVSSSMISPGKRKLQLRVFDVPVEKPSKKLKKKKNQKQVVHSDVDDIMKEFQEIDMINLTVE